MELFNQKVNIEKILPSDRFEPNEIEMAFKINEVVNRVNGILDESGMLTPEEATLVRNLPELVIAINQNKEDVSAIFNRLRSLERIVDVLEKSNELKVDKIDGKGLSTNDFTTILKNKLVDMDLTKYYTKTQIDSLNLAVNSALEHKVDKISGKGLSTNDFTTILKNKLEGINLNNYYTKAESDANNTIINSRFSTKVDKVEGKQLSTNDFTLDHRSKLEGINLDNHHTKAETNALVDRKVDKVNGKQLSTHDFTDANKVKLDSINMSNYYTKTQVDTSNTNINNTINTKVDKVSGKGLSTHDFTVAYRNKLDGINIGNYHTKAEATTIHNTKVDKVSGKGLSTHDFTTTLKTKVDGIENKYYNKDEVNTIINDERVKINKNTTDIATLKDGLDIKPIKDTIENSTTIKIDNTLHGKVEDLKIYGNTKYIKTGEEVEVLNSNSIKVDNSIEGEVKDLKIYGNTVGGYDSETSTSFPLQSVAEAENGLIVAKTCGKQQWDIEEWKKNKSYKCKAFANTKYRQSMGYQQVATVFYDKDKRRISDTYDATFTTPINCKFIAFGGGCLNPNDINHDRFLKIMLTLGDNISTDYEPYQESVVQVQLPFEEGLKSVSNSICDKIQSSNVTQKIGQHIFNGTENFRSFVKNTNTSYSTFDLDNVKGGSASPMKCNRLPHMHSFEDVAHIHSNRNQLTLTLNNSEMDSVDLIGFKNLIKKYSDSNEPIIVQYELAEPIIHEIPTQKLSTFKTITTLSVDTGINPSKLELSYPVKEEYVDSFTKYCRLQSVGDNLISSTLNSVGQKEKGLIITKTYGKNLWNGVDVLKGYYSSEGILNGPNESFTSTTCFIVKLYNNGKYTITKNGGTRFNIASSKEYPKIGDRLNVLHTQNIEIGTKTIDIKNGDNYLIVYVTNEDGYENIKLQVEKGDILTDFEEYKESVVQVKLPQGMESLKSIGNVQDEINLNKNIIQKFERLVLDETIGWQLVSVDTKTVRFIQSNENRPNLRTNSKCLSNKLSNLEQDDDSELIRIDGSTPYGVINIRVSKKSLESYNEIGLKKLLKKWNTEGNPLEVICELKDYIIHNEPKQIPLSTNKRLNKAKKIDLKNTELKSYNGMTNLCIESIIAPLKMEVLTNKSFGGIVNQNTERLDVLERIITNEEIDAIIAEALSIV